MNQLQNDFQGTNEYVASQELLTAVNVAITLQKPLLIKGEPGTGKTALAEAIANQYGIHLIDATKQQMADLFAYDLIGFASGIDFGKFYEVVEQFLEENLPENKRVFFLYTCAKVSNRFTENIKSKQKSRGKKC